MVDLDTCSPEGLHQALNSFALEIDKDCSYRNEFLDGVGIGRTFARRGCLSETNILFYASRHRRPDDKVLTNIYRFEEKSTTRLTSFPEGVLRLLEDDLDSNVALWMDDRASLSFDYKKAVILVEREQTYGVEDCALLEVPVIDGTPIFSEAGLDVQEDLEQKVATNGLGLSVAEVCLRGKDIRTPESEVIDEFEKITQALGGDSGVVADAVTRMLGMVTMLRP